MEENSKRNFVAVVFEWLQNLCVAILEAWGRLSETRTRSYAERKAAAGRLATEKAEAKRLAAEAWAQARERVWELRILYVRAKKDAAFELIGERFHVWKVKWEWRQHYLKELYVWYCTRRADEDFGSDRKKRRFPRLTFACLVGAIASLLTIVVALIFPQRFDWTRAAILFTVFFIAWLILRRIGPESGPKAKAFLLRWKDRVLGSKRFYAGLLIAALLVVTVIGMLAKATYLWTLTAYLAYMSWKLRAQLAEQKPKWARVTMPMRSTLILGIWLITVLTRTR